MDYTILTSGSIQRTNSDGSLSIIPPRAENSDYQVYLAWVAGGNTATVETAATQTSDIARQKGEAYVGKFFTALQMMKLIILLQSSSTPTAQLAKVQAVYTWLNTIEAAWLSTPTTFDPTTFGNPPYMYNEILSVT